MKSSIILSLLVLSILLSGCVQLDTEDDGREWHEINSGWLSGGSYYNGTRFFVEDFTPINLEEKQMGFTLTMDLVFKDYCDNLTLNISTRSVNVTISPEKYGEQMGRYIIKDLYLQAEGDRSEYPFDEHKVNITFTADNDEGKFNLNNIKQNVSSSRWRLDVYGEANQLFFTFSRVEEINSFNILKNMGIISIVISATSLIIYLIIWHYNSKNNKLLDSGNFLFYFGNVVGVPFYIGVIFNHIIYTFPTLDCIHALELWSLWISSILLGAFVFMFRGKIKKQEKV